MKPVGDGWERLAGTLWEAGLMPKGAEMPLSPWG